MKTAGKAVDPERGRLSYLTDALMHYKEQLGDRLLETRNLFGPVTLIDPHTHSDCGDGRGAVAQNYEAAMACGLDFIYVTDHNTIEPKKYSRMLEGISWGQEPICGNEHVVILNNNEVFDPSTCEEEDFYRQASRCGAFSFMPHPAGHGVPDPAPEERADRLQEMAGNDFAMEIINGVFKLFRAWDECDEAAVNIWDRLLERGCRVVPLGGSDAHDPFSIGTAWTGVFCDGMSHKNIIAAMQAGRCFASEAAMLDFTCCGIPSGGTLEAPSRQVLNFTLRAADFFGLHQVRLLAGGKVVKMWSLDNTPLFEEEWQAISSGGREYYRLEAISRDDRRAFSAPLYIRP